MQYQIFNFTCAIHRLQIIPEKLPSSGAEIMILLLHRIIIHSLLLLVRSAYYLVQSVSQSCGVEVRRSTNHNRLNTCWLIYKTN